VNLTSNTDSTPIPNIAVNSIREFVGFKLADIQSTQKRNQ